MILLTIVDVLASSVVGGAVLLVAVTNVISLPELASSCVDKAMVSEVLYKTLVKIQAFSEKQQFQLSYQVFKYTINMKLSLGQTFAGSNFHWDKLSMYVESSKFFCKR